MFNYGEWDNKRWEAAVGERTGGKRLCERMGLRRTLKIFIQYYLLKQIQSMSVGYRSKLADQMPRNKFQLHETVRDYIQICLPKFMGIRTTDLTDEKRNRTPKKTEEIYDTEFFNQIPGKTNPLPVSAHPKNDKKISTKDKDKSKEMPEERPLKEPPKAVDKVVLPKDEVKQIKPASHKIPRKDAPEKKPKQSVLRASPKKEKMAVESFVKLEETELKKTSSAMHSKKVLDESFQIDWRKKQKEAKPVKKEKMEEKRRMKRKESLKKSGSDPQEHHESHSFAPSKDDHSAPLESSKAFKNRLNAKPTLGEERREHPISQCSGQMVGENSNDSSNPDQRQLSPSSKTFCLRFLNKLKSYKSSWPFRLPVDPIAQGVPNYFQIVHRPMDLKTIEKKVTLNKYEHVAEFHGDVNKIFLNSYKFNPRETNYYKLTVELEAYYYDLLQEVEVNPAFLNMEVVPKVKSSKVEQDFTEETPLKKKKTSQLLRKSKFLSKCSNGFEMKDSSENNAGIQVVVENDSKARGANRHEESMLHEVKEQEMVVANPIQMAQPAQPHEDLFEGLVSTPKKPVQKPSNGQKSNKKKSSMKEDPEYVVKKKEYQGFSLQDKKKLRDRILKLSPECLENVMLIVYGEEYLLSNENTTEFQIELEGLGEEKLRRLEGFVKERESYKGEEPTCLEKYFTTGEYPYLF